MNPSRDDALKIVTGIWEELLEIEVGPDDDVFDLGAYSLLVVDVVGRAREAGLSLKALDVFQNPTPAAQAEIGTSRAGIVASDVIAETWRTSLSPWDEQAPPNLIPLVPDGDGDPLFCVHLGTGHIRIIAPLIEAARVGRPVYGFESVGYRAPVRPFLSVGETAEHYARQLRSVQPTGPYHLTGLCAGAVIALEMAQRLHDAGEEVASLILVDLPSGMPELDPGWGLTEHFDYLLGSLRSRFGDPVTELPSVLRELKDRIWFEETDEEEDFYRLAVLWAACQFAQEHYEPRPYPGPVTIISPLEYEHRLTAYWSPFLPQAKIVHTPEFTMVKIVKDAGVATAFAEALVSSAR